MAKAASKSAPADSTPKSKKAAKAVTPKRAPKPGTPPTGRPAPEPVWKPTRNRSLEVGDVIRLPNPKDQRCWFVVYVNASRARVVPITATQREVDTGSGRVTFSQTGDGLDISPNSLVELVDPDALTDDEAIRAARFAELELSRQMTAEDIERTKRDEIAAEKRRQEAMSNVAEVPLPAATQSNKQKNAARLAALKEKGAKAKAAKVAKGEKVPGEKKVKAEKVMKPCKCGCGEQTSSWFVPGHDARFKGWLLKVERGKMKVEELPKSVQKSYEWKKKGGGYIPTTNYKGEKHTGYDEA